jgi:hypothetical protein
MHYLLAVAAGIAAGGLVGCGMLLAGRTGQRAGAGTSPGGTPVLASHRKPGPDSIEVIIAACYRTLLDTVVSFDDPSLGQLTGWPHFFDEAVAGTRPTAYGTAYGLKLAMTLSDQDGRLDRGALTDTLWKVRRPDGGWASRTQGAISRPEVTAVALGALSSVGCDPVRLAGASDAFEAMLVAGADSAAMTSTFVAASATRELTRIRPRSAVLTEMRTRLLAGAIRDPHHDDLLCWSARLDATRFQVPSPAHTALAVIALARLAHVQGDDTQSRSAIEQSLRWLIANGSYERQTDQIRRFVTADHWESLTVGLFTPAWIARALIAGKARNIPDADAFLDEAIRAILRAHRDGIWEWGDGTHPIWMTYQAVTTLRAFALHRWTAP